MYRNINFCTFITVFAAEKIKTAGTFPIPILTMLSGLDIALQTTHKSQNTLTVTSAVADPEPCVGEPQRGISSLTEGWAHRGNKPVTVENS